MNFRKEKREIFILFGLEALRQEQLARETGSILYTVYQVRVKKNQVNNKKEGLKFKD